LIVIFIIDAFLIGVLAPALAAEPALEDLLLATICTVEKLHFWIHDLYLAVLNKVLIVIDWTSRPVIFIFISDLSNRFQLLA